jgi:hypothetical protein
MAHVRATGHTNVDLIGAHGCLSMAPKMAIMAEMEEFLYHDMRPTSLHGTSTSRVVLMSGLDVAMTRGMEPQPKARPANGSATLLAHTCRVLVGSKVAANGNCTSTLVPCGRPASTQSSALPAVLPLVQSRVLSFSACARAAAEATSTAGGAPETSSGLEMNTSQVPSWVANSNTKGVLMVEFMVTLPTVLTPAPGPTVTVILRDPGG